MTNSSLGRVVRSLRLRNVDNGARHATNHYNAARSVALHQVLGNTGREQVGTIHDDTPQLLHTVVGVRDGIEVLREASRGDQAVDSTVLVNDLLERCVDGIRVGNVGVVRSDLGHSGKPVSS